MLFFKWEGSVKVICLRISHIDYHKPVYLLDRSNKSRYPSVKYSVYRFILTLKEHFVILSKLNTEMKVGVEK
jgi:hypothetical protein